MNTTFDFDIFLSIYHKCFAPLQNVFDCIGRNLNPYNQQAFIPDDLLAFDGLEHNG